MYVFKDGIQCSILTGNARENKQFMFDLVKYKILCILFFIYCGKSPSILCFNTNNLFNLMKAQAETNKYVNNRKQST